jgi:hypothetical protein
MTYKETDNIANLKVRDTLVMNDGSVHRAITDTDGEGCDECSLDMCGICGRVLCLNGEFHFKRLIP